MRLKSLIRKTAKRGMITAGLESAWLLKKAGLMGSARGRGAIFTLHHVRPKVPRATGFDPNGHLEITPEFLSAAIEQLKEDGYAFCPLQALPERLTEERPQPPLAVFTLDDGYRNTLDHAAPVFARHGVPFTVFVAGGFIDRTHSLWWETLEAVLAVSRDLTFDFGAGPERIATATTAERYAAFNRIAAFIHSGVERETVERLNILARDTGIDPTGIVDDLVMPEAQLKTLIASPLATLGAHTVSHRALSRLGEAEARAEMDASANRVSAITGARPASIAYPYGDAPSASPREFRLAGELGFTVGVTTQPGTLAGASPTMTGLPRISLNGYFQSHRYVCALASGIPFRLMGRR